MRNETQNIFKIHNKNLFYVLFIFRYILWFMYDTISYHDYKTKKIS